jgi:stage IV sporulation protein FB
MQGLMSWSVPFTRIAGITVRVHLLFIVFMVAMVLDAHKSGHALETFLFMIMLFAIVLMHELGHCFAARAVGGSAEDILLWPLGGLAYVNHPHNPWAYFITIAGGPAVNLVFCLITSIIIILMGYWPPLHPLWNSFDSIGTTAGISVPMESLPWYTEWLIRFYFLNWFLFLFNVCFLGFPLDGGRMLQAFLWHRTSYYQGTKVVCYTGFVFAVLLGLSMFIFVPKEDYSTIIMTVFLCMHIVSSCQMELQKLEMGPVDDSPYGDFSEGYTSLERSTRQRDQKPGLFQRWMAERAERKKLREEEQELADRQREEDILDKIRDHGMGQLTKDEKRFLKQLSEKARKKLNR